jgi:hypothetical protein
MKTDRHFVSTCGKLLGRNRLNNYWSVNITFSDERFSEGGGKRMLQNTGACVPKYTALRLRIHP